MRVNVPDDLSAGVIDLRGYGEGQVPVQRDDDGQYVDVDGERAARAVADAYDGANIVSDADGDSADAAASEGTCDTVMNSGEVCGRGLPCPYHTEDE